MKRTIGGSSKMDNWEEKEFLFYLRNIRKTFHNGACLDFQGEMIIRRGCFTFITGNSGIGKSSLLNILGLLDKADNSQGDAVLHYRSNPGQANGHDYFQLYKNDRWHRLFSKSVRAHLRQKDFGFLPQGGHLLHSFSIRQNLEAIYMLRNPNYAEESMQSSIKAVLDSVDFKADLEKWKLSPAVLSGGEAQRLALARAILCNPKVIFVDEPTTFMDGELVELTMKCLLDRLNSSGCSIIIISHDYKELQVILKGMQKDARIDFFKFKKEANKNIQAVTWDVQRYDEMN